jgi:hypothetical protein
MNWTGKLGSAKRHCCMNTAKTWTWSGKNFKIVVTTSTSWNADASANNDDDDDDDNNYRIWIPMSRNPMGRDNNIVPSGQA